MELNTLVSRRKKKEANRPKQISDEQRKEQVKKFTTFYRRNINLYCSEYLKLNLYPFQHIMLYLMNLSMVFVCIASRGIGKITMY